MRTIHSILRSVHTGCSTLHLPRPIPSGRILSLVLAALCLGMWAHAQDDPLNKVHVPPPSSTAPGTPATGAPAGAESPAATGAAAAK